MPRHQETRRLGYTPEQLFDLVADVGRYQEFLPWVISTRVRSRSDLLLTADVMVGFKMLRETFTSRVTLARPDHVHVDYVDGPLKFLKNDWRFTPDGQRTIVDFSVDFEFRSRIFESLAGAVFGEALRRMVSAFEQRAADLYDAPSGISNSSAHLTA